MNDRDCVLLAIRLLDETGLRLRDLPSLRCEAFDPSSGMLSFDLEDRGERDRRRIRLSRLLRQGLSRLQRERSQDQDGALFTLAGGSSLTAEALRRIWVSDGGVSDAPGMESVLDRWEEDWSSRYLAARREDRVRAAVRKALAGRRNPKVFELGCGEGEMLRRLDGDCFRPADARSVGVERVPEIARAARGEKGKGGPQWVVGDAFSLPLPTAAFDIALCVEVLEHFPVPRVALREMARCLRPGGVLIATTPSPAGLFARLASLRRWRDSWSGDGGLEALRHGYVPMVDPREVEKSMVYGHVSARSPAEWAGTFAASGLRLERALPISLASPHLFFDRRPWALGLLRMANFVLLPFPGVVRFCTEICYVARKGDA